MVIIAIKLRNVKRQKFSCVKNQIVEELRDPTWLREAIASQLRSLPETGVVVDYTFDIFELSFEQVNIPTEGLSPSEHSISVQVVSPSGEQLVAGQRSCTLVDHPIECGKFIINAQKDTHQVDFRITNFPPWSFFFLLACLLTLGNCDKIGAWHTVGDIQFFGFISKIMYGKW